VSCNFNIARGRVRSVVADAVARRVVAGPSEVRLMRRYQVRKRRKAPCVTQLQYFSVVNHKSPQIPPYHNRFNPPFRPTRPARNAPLVLVRPVPPRAHLRVSSSYRAEWNAESRGQAVPNGQSGHDYAAISTFRCR
jgi:hypothetical protein